MTPKIRTTVGFFLYGRHSDVANWKTTVHCTCYYTLNPLSLFWLVESVQLIFEISACDVISTEYTSIMSRTLKVRIIMSSWRALCCLPSVKKQTHDFHFFRSVYSKTIIRFGFCDIQNNQGLGKGYQPKPKALPRPWLFWISQKPHPIIVYNWSRSHFQASPIISTQLLR